MIAVLVALVGCSDSFTDERDGQRYEIVKIGNAVWMARNLNFAGGKFDGSKDGLAGSFCPEGDDRKCKEYGRLYTWAAAQIACPSGWRLPSATDFDALFMAAMAADVRGAAMANAPNISTVGKMLKSTGGWFKNGNGTDDVGFNALPAGYMTAPADNNADGAEQPAAGKFDGIGGYAYFWSSTTDEQEPSFAYYLFLDFSSPVAGLNSFDKGSARSVRCVRN